MTVFVPVLEAHVGEVINRPFGVFANESAAIRSITEFFAKKIDQSFDIYVQWVFRDKLEAVAYEKTPEKRRLITAHIYKYEVE